MRRHSNTFEVWILGGVLARFFFLKAIFDIFFEEWLKGGLEHALGATVTEMIERFSAIILPTIGAVLIVMGVYRYIRGEFEDLSRPQLKFGSIQNNTEFPGLGSKQLNQRLIEVENAGKGILRDCMVTVESIVFDDGTMLIPRCAIPTVARAHEGKVGRFNLDHGIPKQLLLTSCDLSDPRNPGPHRIMTEHSSVALYPMASPFARTVAAPMPTIAAG